MAPNKNNKWFKDIAPPLSCSLRNGADYLDSLMGCGEPKRQFMTPAYKKDAPKVDCPQSNKRHKTNMKPSKKIAIELDDEKWIEERKKKYPKTEPSIKSQGSVPIDIQPTNDTISCKNKTNLTKAVQPAIKLPHENPRKKTLFEKLME